IGVLPCASFSRTGEFLETLRHWFHFFTDVQGLIHAGGYIGLSIIVFAETGLMVGFFLPGDSLLVTAGVFAAQGKLNLWLLMGVLVVAAIVGDTVGYWIGHKAGPALFRRPKSLLFNP